MTCSLFLLLAVILISGILGGSVNYMLTTTAPPEDDSAQRQANAPPWGKNPLYYQNILLGIAAAMVVPVFLQIAAVGVDDSLITNFLTKTSAASPTIDDLASGYTSLASIGGFCILAAVSSRSFLTTLSQRLLNQARDKANQANETAQRANEDAQRAEEEARQATEAQKGLRNELNARFQDDDEELVQESDDDPDIQEALTAETTAGLMTFAAVMPDEELSALDKDILKTLAKKPNTRRSIKGLRSDSDLIDSQGFTVVSQHLHQLAAWGYVKKLRPTSTSSPLPRWQLDTKGWAQIDVP